MSYLLYEFDRNKQYYRIYQKHVKKIANLYASLTAVAGQEIKEFSQLTWHTMWLQEIFLQYR